MFPAGLDRPENRALLAQRLEMLPARPRGPADNPALYRDADADAEQQKAAAA